MSLLLLILGQWREHGGVLLAVTLASILSAASVSEVSTMGDPAPAVGWGIVLLSMTSFFLLATLLSSWSQPDAVALRVAGAPRWLPRWRYSYTWWASPVQARCLVCFYIDG